MAYIGKQPVVGNFQVCDAISVVNGQAAYTMQVASANVEPENANHMLVSLNGVLQKPGSSFTISGATITFASNLVTNDVIDFIILLGDTLNVGTPSDNGVTTASIAANAVTGAKLNTDVISAQTALTSAPADTDEFLVSDAGTIKRIDYSLIKGGGEWTKLLHTTASNSSVVAFNSTYITDTYQDYKVVFSNVHPASNDVYLNSYFSDDNGSSDLTLDSILRGYKDDGTLSTRSDNTSNTYLRLQTNETMGNDDGLSIGGFIELIAPYKNDTRTFMFGRSFTNIGDSQFAFFHNLFGAGTLGNTSMNYIKFSFSSGNITSGEFTLYGRKIT